MTKGLWKRSVTRISVLTALGALTLAVPLTGFVGTDTSLAVTGRSISVAPAESESWAYSASTGGRTAEKGASEGDTGALVPASLAMKEGAGARARMHEAANSDGCPAAEKTSARGDLAVLAGIDENSIVYPLVSYHISSPFGYRIHPIFGVGRLHAGVDMSAPAMAPVYAAAKGTVTKIGTFPGSGHAIVITHNINGEKFDTHYYHLTIGSEKVKVGDQVKVGQHIAGVGSTGNSTGNHLHFEVHPNGGEPIDPIPWLAKHHAQHLGDNKC